LQERIIQEIAFLKERYPFLQHGQNYDWVMLPDFPLPEGYNRSATNLMFLIPHSYPHTPPDCFYVEIGLRLSSNELPSNYNEHMDVPVGGSWGYFSWHPEIWQAAGRMQEGDNLNSFIKAVNFRLREVN